MAKRRHCISCFKEPLDRDEVGICMKLLGDDGEGYFCIECLSAYLGCEVQELLDKIEEFKDEGCTLFQ